MKYVILLFLFPALVFASLIYMHLIGRSIGRGLAWAGRKAQRKFDRFFFE